MLWKTAFHAVEKQRKWLPCRGKSPKCPSMAWNPHPATPLRAARTGTANPGIFTAKFGMNGPKNAAEREMENI